jgi:hypothetical protein
MKLELVENELTAIRMVFDDVDASDASATIQKYAIILCLFDVITRRVEENRDAKNFNESIDGLGISVIYFKEKLGMFVGHFTNHIMAIQTIVWTEPDSTLIKFL